jgi:hypothetical protein
VGSRSEVLGLQGGESKLKEIVEVFEETEIKVFKLKKELLTLIMISTKKILTMLSPK